VRTLRRFRGGILFSGYFAAEKHFYDNAVLRQVGPTDSVQPNSGDQPAAFAALIPYRRTLHAGIMWCKLHSSGTWVYALGF
jgi:hypothetical protein